MAKFKSLWRKKQRGQGVKIFHFVQSFAGAECGRGF